MNIAVAMSGGMDSLLALLLLREKGREVMAVHAHFLPPGGEELRVTEELAALCKRLGVPFHALDLRREFEELVISPFMQAYVAGETPNPCAHCNRHLKFGLLQDRMLELGAERVATGHYARIAEAPEGGAALVRGDDPVKDQSYFLTLVPLARLEKTVFPLGSWRKADVPAALASRGVAPPLPRQSLEVCFIPGDDYREFLEHRGARLSGPGPIRLADGAELGRHRGLWRHTIGQRKGLGVGWKEPLYVLAKNMAENALIVAPKSELSTSRCKAHEVNLLAPFASWPKTVLAQTCYRQRPRPAKALFEDGELRLAFDEPLSRPTPGQVAAVFDSMGRAYAGGLIR